MSYTENAATNTTNGTTDVELVAAPTGSTVKTIYTATAFNPNATTRVVTFAVKESGTKYEVLKESVAQDNLASVPERVTLTSGQSFVVVLDGIPSAEWRTYVAYAEVT